MNIALWLERAGLSHGAVRPSAHGTRVARSYGELAATSGQARGRASHAVRSHAGRAGGDLCEELAGVHGGSVRDLDRRPRRRAGECQAAWPRARLYPGALRRARVFRLRRSRGGRQRARAANVAAAHHHRLARARGAVHCRCDLGRAAQRQRSRLAVLHLRHHRPAEGRDADASRAELGEPRLSQRCRSCGRG